MKDKPKLQVTSGAIEDGEQQMVLRLKLRNESDSTLHVISDVRQVLYDPVTRELTLRLTDSELAPLPFQAPYEAPPPMAAVDPHGEREITVKCPRFVTRVEPGPRIVQLPAHEAETVTVQIGWSDRAFYRDTRSGKGGGMQAQLKKWERGVTRFQGLEIRKRPKDPSSAG